MTSRSTRSTSTPSLYDFTEVPSREDEIHDERMKYYLKKQQQLSDNLASHLGLQAKFRNDLEARERRTSTFRLKRTYNYKPKETGVPIPGYLYKSLPKIEKERSYFASPNGFLISFQHSTPI